MPVTFLVLIGLMTMLKPIIYQHAACLLKQHLCTFTKGRSPVVLLVAISLVTVQFP